MNKETLMKKMKEKGISIKEMYNTLHISRSAFYRKCNGKSEFTLKEITQIMSILEIEDPSEIFLLQKCPKGHKGSALCSRLPPGSDAVRPKAKHRKCRASFRPDIPFRPYRFQRHAGKALRPNAVVPGPRGGVPPRKLREVTR